MKAILHTEYGPPDLLRFEDVDKPVPGDDEVLIEVRAASVNPYDWRIMRGRPRFMRMMTGSGKPKNPRFGVDVAGRVEAVGKKVTKHKAGDEVFGTAEGAFAEYVCTGESKVVTKPSNVTFEQGAAVGIAGGTALQGLRDFGKVRSGEKVLINGAAGGVGTFAVQIAKLFGAHVTGVCSGRNADMVRSIGADDVVDYTREDFAKSGKRYDVLLDCVGNRRLRDCRRALERKGRYVMIGAPDGDWAPLALMLKVLLLSPFVSQKLRLGMAQASESDLGTFAEWMAAGKITPVIDRQYLMRETAEAVRYLETGHARGKVILTAS